MMVAVFQRPSLRYPPEPRFPTRWSDFVRMWTRNHCTTGFHVQPGEPDTRLTQGEGHGNDRGEAHRDFNRITDSSGDCEQASQESRLKGSDRTCRTRESGEDRELGVQRRCALVAVKIIPSQVAKRWRGAGERHKQKFLSSQTLKKLRQIRAAF